MRLFFLGGSTTFGWYQRNEETIPAEAARQLQKSLGDRARVEVTNFGVPGHVFTQEMLTLMLQLRAGARPDIVVFYDGINDVASTVQNGVAGMAQNESNRRAGFARGRQLAGDTVGGLRNDIRFVGRTAASVLGRLEIVKRLSARAATTPPIAVSADTATARIVRMYTANARIIEALAKEYGFEVLYVWQPVLMSSKKRLTSREQWLTSTVETDPWARTIRDVHVAVPPMLAAAMRPIVGARFVDGTALFSGDTTDVYADLFGHTFGYANPQIVAAILPPLAVAAQRRARGATTTKTNYARFSAVPATGAPMRSYCGIGMVEQVKSAHSIFQRAPLENRTSCNTRPSSVSVTSSINQSPCDQKRAGRSRPAPDIRSYR